MKTLLTLLLAALTAHAATQIYTTITPTNAAAMTNGMQLTANGDVRFAVTNITNSALNFQITNSNARLTTNLYTHLLSARFTNTTLSYYSSNAIRLVGGTNYALAVSQFGNWCSISNYTSTVYSATYYTTPYTTEGDSYRRWEQNNNASNLSTYATFEWPWLSPMLGAARTALTNNFLHRGANDLDLASDFYVQVTGQTATRWAHFDAWAGGADGLPLDYTSDPDPQGGTDGRLNPGLVSLIGDTETLANKSLVNPIIISNLNGSFTLTGNVTFAGSVTLARSPIFQSGFTNEGSTLLNPRLISVDSTGGEFPGVQTFTFPGGHSTLTNPVSLITLMPGTVSEKKWNFGTYNAANQVSGYNGETVARIDDISVNVVTNLSGKASGVASLDASAHILPSQIAKGTTHTNSIFNESNVLNGVIAKTAGSVTTLNASNNVVALPTNEVHILSGASGVPTITGFTNIVTGVEYSFHNQNGTDLLLEYNSGYANGATKLKWQKGFDGARYVIPQFGWFKGRSDGSFFYVSSINDAQNTNEVILDIATTNSTHVSLIASNLSSGAAQLKSIEQGSGIALSITPTSVVVTATASGAFVGSSNGFGTNLYLAGDTTVESLILSDLELDILAVDEALLLNYVTPSRAAVINGDGILTNSTVTTTELGRLSGITGNIETNLASLDAAMNNANGMTNRFHPASTILSNITVAPLTNANAFQPASTTLTNISGTGALTNANSNQFTASSGVISEKSGSVSTNKTIYGNASPILALVADGPGTTNLYVGTNGNTGINTNAPKASLDVNGGIRAGQGGSANPSYSFNSHTNTGFYDRANSIGLTIGGLVLAEWQSDTAQGQTILRNYPIAQSSSPTGTAPDGWLYPRGSGNWEFRTNVVALGTITATNGFASYATISTVVIVSTGITNTSGLNYRLMGLTGTSVCQTNTRLATGFSRGTIATPTDIELQPNEFIIGSSITVQNHQAN